MWGEPPARGGMPLPVAISTHSPRVGRTERLIGLFGSTSAFQLTRPVWGEPFDRWNMDFTIDISTHSPRVGRTKSCQASLRVFADFNSLAPCGANRSSRSLSLTANRFQLTRPVWGEPVGVVDVGRFQRHFNSLAPCGANLYWPALANIGEHFNSLAPCGANLSDLYLTDRLNIFQLTRPVWGEP